ncbi:MAG: RNA polymerase sigma factor [Verrucomicrobiales bacterium]
MATNISPEDQALSSDGEVADNDLVAASQKGDVAAFEDLVTRHRGRVYAMVRKMVKNDADAWDLSQEIFIKVWKALPKFEARARFSTWLYRVSHNVVYDWLRKRKIEAEGELDDQLLNRDQIATGATTMPTGDQRPDEALEQSELRLKIEAALEKISPSHREVILLREVQGMDYKEIADAVDCSLGTVMSRLYYARKKLQELLKDEK